jgi:hypothetical protein
MGLSFEWSQCPNVPTPNWAHSSMGGNKAQVPNKNKNKLPMAVTNICLVSSFEWSQGFRCPNSKLCPNSCQNFNGGIKQQQQVANSCSQYMSVALF